MGWRQVGPEHVLLTSQWDSVFEAIGDDGFDPAEFTRTTIHGDVFGNTVPRLVHEPTGSDFVFDFHERSGGHAPNWSPGEQRPRDVAQSANDWPTTLILVRMWLRNVERERSSLDLWAMLDQQRELLAATEATGDTANTPFSPEEQAQISEQLNEMKQLLVQQHGADPRALESRIEELEEASTRIGRREWLLMFLGAIFHWTLTGLIPPEGLRAVLKLAAVGIGHLFGGGVPELPMP
jgi:hypothetical protein